MYSRDFKLQTYKLNPVPMDDSLKLGQCIKQIPKGYIVVCFLANRKLAIMGWAESDHPLNLLSCSCCCFSYCWDIYSWTHAPPKRREVKYIGPRGVITSCLVITWVCEPHLTSNIPSLSPPSDSTKEGFEDFHLHEDPGVHGDWEVYPRCHD